MIHRLETKEFLCKYNRDRIDRDLTLYNQRGEDIGMLKYLKHLYKLQHSNIKKVLRYVKRTKRDHYVREIEKKFKMGLSK